MSDNIDFSALLTPKAINWSYNDKDFPVLPSELDEDSTASDITGWILGQLEQTRRSLHSRGCKGKRKKSSRRRRYIRNAFKLQTPRRESIDRR
jgi:hypothetical protein